MDSVSAEEVVSGPWPTVQVHRQGRSVLPLASAIRLGVELRGMTIGRRAIKRAFDLVLASLALLLALPVLLLIGIAIRVDSPGPALFRQTRIGYLGRPFTIYKFRSMCSDADDAKHREYVLRLLHEDAPPVGGPRNLYKLEHDTRITRVGRLLRRTSLDELPQLLNVVRGNMSMVGPRPALDYEAEAFSPAQLQRFRVPPGITGLWQVRGRNALTMPQALELDLDYVERQGLLFDLAILARTVPVVLRGSGAG